MSNTAVEMLYEMYQTLDQYDNGRLDTVEAVASLHWSAFNWRPRGYPGSEDALRAVWDIFYPTREEELCFPDMAPEELANFLQRIRTIVQSSITCHQPDQRHRDSNSDFWADPQEKARYWQGFEDALDKD